MLAQERTQRRAPGARPGTLLRAPRAGNKAPNSRSCASLGHPAPCFRREAPSARGSQREGVNRRRSGHRCPGPDPLHRGAPESCVSWFLMQRRPGAPTGSSFGTGLRRAHFRPSSQRNRVRAGAGPQALMEEGHAAQQGMPMALPGHPPGAGCAKVAVGGEPSRRSGTILFSAGPFTAPVCPPGGKGTDGGPAAPFAAPSAEVGRGIIRRCLSERSAASRVQRRPRPASERGNPGPRQRTGMRQSG